MRKRFATNLVTTFTLSPGATATVNGVIQASGETANDFAKPVTYVVQGADGVFISWYNISIRNQKPT